MSHTDPLRESTESLRLCFVDGDWAYFTDADPTDVSGDDWNDAPHDCNASSPYSGFEEIVKVAYDGEFEVQGVDPGGRFGYLSADDINAGRAPWLVTLLYGQERAADGYIRIGVRVDAGVTLAEFRTLVRKAGGSVYEVAP